MAKAIKVFLVPLLLWAFSAPSLAGISMANSPLYISSSTPPNVLIEMSIENTMGALAYNDEANTAGLVSTDDAYCDGRQSFRLGSRSYSSVGTCYNSSRKYFGYFDGDKCYQYNSTSDFFYPTGSATNHTCSGAFSGNFMNWVSMTAMDMFIQTMTGGYRDTDTNDATRTYNTIIKRAPATGWIGHRKMIGTSIDSTASGINVTPSTVIPHSPDALLIERNSDFEIKMTQLSNSGSSLRTDTYEIKVAACVNGLLEGNCVKYGSVYKPEGLIQEKSDTMRFAVSAYLNHGGNTRHGGVMRTLMKSVTSETDSNGLIINNPDSLSSYSYSGVLNYINRFSQLGGYKSKDPVSELYYESLRYLMGKKEPTEEYVDNYSSYTGGLPVYDGDYGDGTETDWDDPWQYSCQKSFIIGINDANPWADKRLPGTSFTSSSVNISGGSSFSLDVSNDYGEPSSASGFKAIAPGDAAESQIDVSDLTDSVGALEGLNGTTQCIGCVIGGTACTGSIINQEISTLGNVMGTCPDPYKENSYYIAGLAYMANTYDVRPDLAGKQTIQTFMIDTQEYKTNRLMGQMNMLWLAGKYGGFIDSNNNNQPDLASEWDENGDGEPDNYVLATDSYKMVESLNTAFQEIEERSASSATIATNSSRVNTNTAIYQALYDSADWSGNLRAYAIDTATGAIASTPTWEASNELQSNSSRSIFTMTDAATPAGIEFLWANLTATQQAYLNQDMTGTTDSYGEERLAFIKGDLDVYDDVVPNFRYREFRLGDIVNSNPLYVGISDLGYGQPYSGLTSNEITRYRTFRNTSNYLTRDSMIYVGANDGMLHAFNAATGDEEFAYIPSELIPKLNRLTDQRYDHEYFVDGSPRYNDVYLNGSWKTLLIGSTAAGGKGVYTLDITDPDSFSASKAMWEFTNDDDNDLGNVLGQPTIVRMDNGTWVALVGNGPNNNSDEAILFVLDASDGSVIAKISTGSGSGSEPNGLMAPVPVDIDGDRDSDFVYAGDLLGNLWKFELRTNGNWEPTPTLLFTACESDTTTCPTADRQPITSRPAVIKHPDGVGYMIYFGTGRYFAAGDNVVPASPRTEAFYGIWDNGTNSPEIDRLSELVEQSILREDSLTDANGDSVGYRITSSNSVDYSSKKGWYMKLHQVDNATLTYTPIGERVINSPVVRGDRVVFATLIPSIDPCSYGGSSWLMELDKTTGARLSKSPLDVNNDGLINTADLQSLNGTDTVVSGVGGNTIWNGPTTISSTTGALDYNYLSGSDGSTDMLVSDGAQTLYERQSWRQLK